MSMHRRPEFAQTRWTLVLQAGSGSPHARAALGELCEIYYAPVVAFIKQWRNDPDDGMARDLAHGFFESVLGRGDVGSPDPSQGRFRSYLLGAVKHFLLVQLRQENTAKRGGSAEHETLPDEQASPVEVEENFDREWATALISKALAELETEMLAAGKAEQFTVLKPWLDGNADTPQSEAADALELSGTAVKVAIHRLRERFRAKVRAEVAATLQDLSELDAELRHLVAALAGK